MQFSICVLFGLISFNTFNLPPNSGKMFFFFCILTLDSLSKDTICKKKWDHGCTLSELEQEHCDKDSLDHMWRKMTSFPPFLAEFFVFYIERSEWPLKGQAFEYSLNPQWFGCLGWLDGFVPTYFCQIQRRLHTQGASRFLFVHPLFLSSRLSSTPLGCAGQDAKPGPQNQSKLF